MMKKIFGIKIPVNLGNVELDQVVTKLNMNLKKSGNLEHMNDHFYNCDKKCDGTVPKSTFKKYLSNNLNKLEIDCLCDN